MTQTGTVHLSSKALRLARLTIQVILLGLGCLLWALYATGTTAAWG